jgi:hypothetical protein
VDHTAELAERLTYSAYGEARHHWAADVDGDGAVTTADETIIANLAAEGGGKGTPIDDPAYRAEADLNRDGVIDGDDGRTIHGYTIPTGPKQGLPGARRHSWYVARPEFFEFIYGPDVAPTGDGRLSGRNDVLSRWRGIGAP